MTERAKSQLLFTQAKVHLQNKESDLRESNDRITQAEAHLLNGNFNDILFLEWRE